MKDNKKQIAIFASGSGSNAENIIRHFSNRDCGIEVAMVVTNKPDAGVIARARRLGVRVEVIPSGEFRSGERVIDLMTDNAIDCIVLAGFLMMIPARLIGRYPDRIINIHPSLLPKFGGKGMYGSNVHKAVVEAGEKESGITIHYVTERYDEGAPIFQASVALTPEDTAETVEQKVRSLEAEHFPRVIEELLS